MHIENCDVRLTDGTRITISGDGDNAIKVLQFLSELDNPTIQASNLVEKAKQEVRTIIRANPSQKISAIKKWREVTGSGLKEAKDAVENLMWVEFAIPFPHPTY